MEERATQVGPKQRYAGERIEVTDKKLGGVERVPRSGIESGRRSWKEEGASSRGKWDAPGTRSNGESQVTMVSVGEQLERQCAELRGGWNEVH